MFFLLSFAPIFFKNKTFQICTIHQPRSDIFHLFDSVLLLSKGKMVYYGETKEVTGYFQSLGYQCPEKCNPADFIRKSSLSLFLFILFFTQI
jgi:ABC-type multidrug transport system ATPase subunit